MAISRLGWTAWVALIEENIGIFSAIELALLNQISHTYVHAYDAQRKIFLYEPTHTPLSATDCCVFECTEGFGIVQFIKSS